MMAIETRAIDDQHAIDPAAGIEYLVTTWTDGTQTVCTRAAYGSESWGPALSLRPVAQVAS